MSRRPGVLVAALLLGCFAGSLPDRELPEQPIAVSYRTPEEARKHAESLERAHAESRKTTGPARPRQREGMNDLVASKEDVTKVLSSILGREEEGPREEHPGRLALLDPRTRKLEVVEAARRGSVPLGWSADHERLLFVQKNGNDLQVYEYSLPDRTVRQVTHGPPAHSQACYGTQGRIVVAAVDTREQPMRSRIEISHPGGREPYVPLTPGPADHSPVCQPGGGGAIVFVRERPPRSEIWSLSGGKEKRLSPGRHPTFTPDGEWVVFAAPHGRELRLWRIRPDGSGRAPVGRGTRSEGRPAVSPDGRLVAYVASDSEDPLRRHLYVRRFDGSGDRVLFANGEAEYPVW